ncbi:hypothetical protein N9937_00720 [bacterium]|nr:hypothetical protein [bacterium]
MMDPETGSCWHGTCAPSREEAMTQPSEAALRDAQKIAVEFLGEPPPRSVRLEHEAWVNETSKLAASIALALDAFAADAIRDQATGLGKVAVQMAHDAIEQERAKAAEVQARLDALVVAGSEAVDKLRPVLVEPGRSAFWILVFAIRAALPKVKE